MAFDNTTTIIGNESIPPELKFLNDGTALCTFSVAWNQKKQNAEDVAHYFKVTAWRQLAENVAESFNKGDRVWVFGRLDFSKWEQDGQTRSSVEISAEDAGLSVQWKPATVGEGSQPARREAPRMPEPEIPDHEPF